MDAPGGMVKIDHSPEFLKKFDLNAFMGIGTEWWIDPGSVLSQGLLFLPEPWVLSRPNYERRGASPDFHIVRAFWENKSRIPEVWREEEAVKFSSTGLKLLNESFTLYLSWKEEATPQWRLGWFPTTAPLLLDAPEALYTFPV